MRSDTEAWQRYGAFLRTQAAEAGMGPREIEQAFAEAALRDPGRHIGEMAYSKSHIDRLYSAQTKPKPPLPFTLQFLRITNKAAGLTPQEHERRCDEARSLLRAATAPPRPPDGEDDAASLRHQRDLALAQRDLALAERDLASAAGTETRLRYALRDAEFLLLTLFQITGALREIIAGNDARTLRTGDARELARVRDETRRAEAYQSTAQQEADRVLARRLTLEQLWTRARADLQRLAQHPDVSELTFPHPDTSGPPTLTSPAGLLAQPALGDIAAALTKVHEVNAREDEAVNELHLVFSGSEGFLELNGELEVLLASTRLADPASRNVAISMLAANWGHSENARNAVIRLTADPEAKVRQRAATALSEGWPGHPAAREAVQSLVHEEDPDTRWAVAQALSYGWSNDPSARDTLIWLTGDKVRVVRSRAVNALPHWAGDPTARDAILRFATDPEASKRQEAAMLLKQGWAGDPSARDAILPLVADPERLVRQAAASALPQGWPGDPQALDSLLLLASDEEMLVRGLSALALAAGWAGEPKALNAVLRLASDGDSEVRRYAVRALTVGWPGDRAAREALMRLSGDPDPYVRRISKEALEEAATASGTA